MLYRNPYSRRAFLRGVGGTLIGLPLLEELMGSKAYAQEMERYNYITCFFGLGCASELQEMSNPVMAPLRPYHEAGRLTQFMASYPRYVNEGGGNHETMLPHVTIAQRAFTPERIAGGESLDYFFYRMTGAKPPLDIFSCGNTVLNVNDQVEFNRSYRGSNQSVTPTRSPLDYFNELFGSAVGSDGGATPKSLVLDSVVENYRSLMSEASGLSSNAKAEIQRTLDEVEQLEREVVATVPEYDAFYASLDKSGWDQPNAVISNDPQNDYRQRQGQGENHDRFWVVPLLANITVLGIKLGQVRFGSYALTAGAERATFGPYSGDVHEFYHGNRSGPVTERVQWYVANFIRESAYLLDLLDAEQLEDGRTLLDRTAVLVCTELERHHVRDNLFWALAGGPFNHQSERIGNPDQNGTDTDIYNTIAHGLLGAERPSGYDPDQEHIFGDPEGFNGVHSALLTGR